MTHRAACLQQDQQIDTFRLLGTDNRVVVPVNSPIRIIVTVLKIYDLKYRTKMELKVSLVVVVVAAAAAAAVAAAEKQSKSQSWFHWTRWFQF
jgi:hypothetical protein